MVALNRFDWESAQTAKPEFRRRRAALRFERVLSCKCRDLDPAGKDAVLNLLAVEFAETDAPSGVVTLTFPAGRPCGWRSNAWKPNWPISARPGAGRLSGPRACRRWPAGQGQSEARLGRTAAINFGSELRARRPPRPRFA